MTRRCNLDGQPLSERDQAAVDAFARFLETAQSPIVGRRYLERGAPVVVVIAWRGRGPRNVLIERGDGSRVVRPFRGLRRMPVTSGDR